MKNNIQLGFPKYPLQIWSYESRHVENGLGLGIHKESPSLLISFFVIQSFEKIIRGLGSASTDAGGSIPSVGITIPSVGITIQRLGIVIPKVGILSRELRLAIPMVGITIPGVGITIQRVGIVIPRVGIAAFIRITK